MGTGYRPGEGLEGKLSALGQVAGEPAEADSFAASLFQRDNNDISTGARWPKSDSVEVTHEAQQRMSQEGPSPPKTAENKLVEGDNPLLIVTAQEKQEIKLSGLLDRGNNETAAVRELGQILD